MGSASFLLTPHSEGEFPEEGFGSSSSLLLKIPAPNCNHWSIHEDKKFKKLSLHLANECQEREEQAKAEEKREQRRQRR